MNPQTLTDEQEDEIKLLLLSNDEEEQRRAKNLLYAAYNENILRCIEHHHPGLSADNQETALLASIERFAHVFRGDASLIDRPLKPPLLRTALLVGREFYRKAARRLGRLQEELIRAVAEALKDSELGNTWGKIVDSSFRQRVSDKVREVAATLKPRQRQIAMMFAETWGIGLSEQEAIAEIFRTSGERLTRDSFKRAFDEVRQKLREPILKILIEEGKCPTSLMPKK
jgi:hypothetical protein